MSKERGARQKDEDPRVTATRGAPKFILGAYVRATRLGVGALDLLDSKTVVGKIADGNYVLGIGFATLNGPGDFGLRWCCGHSEAHYGDGDSMYTGYLLGNFGGPSAIAGSVAPGARRCQGGRGYAQRQGEKADPFRQGRNLRSLRQG